MGPDHDAQAVSRRSCPATAALMAGSSRPAGGAHDHGCGPGRGDVAEVVQERLAMAELEGHVHRGEASPGRGGPRGRPWPRPRRRAPGARRGSRGPCCLRRRGVLASLVLGPRLVAGYKNAAVTIVGVRGPWSLPGRPRVALARGLSGPCLQAGPPALRLEQLVAFIGRECGGAGRPLSSRCPAAGAGTQPGPGRVRRIASSPLGRRVRGTRRAAGCGRRVGGAAAHLAVVVVPGAPHGVVALRKTAAGSPVRTTSTPPNVADARRTRVALRRWPGVSPMPSSPLRSCPSTTRHRRRSPRRCQRRPRRG